MKDLVMEVLRDMDRHGMIRDYIEDGFSLEGLSKEDVEKYAGAVSAYIKFLDRGTIPPIEAIDRLNRGVPVHESELDSYALDLDVWYVGRRAPGEGKAVYSLTPLPASLGVVRRTEMVNLLSPERVELISSEDAIELLENGESVPRSRLRDPWTPVWVICISDEAQVPVKVFYSLVPVEEVSYRWAVEDLTQEMQGDPHFRGLGITVEQTTLYWVAD